MPPRQSQFLPRRLCTAASPAAGRHALLAAAVTAALAAALPAQRLFDPLRKRSLPELRDAATSIAVGDVDGDGTVDAVLGVARGPNRLWLGNGDGTFRDGTFLQMPPDGDFTTSVALGDLDGDGDLDLVCGNAVSGYSTAQNRIYRNDGHGAFTDVTGTSLPGNLDATMAVTLGDLDGDGDLDLVCAGQTDQLLVNDGTGVFLDGTAGHLPADGTPTQAIAPVDVDGDGDLDLVLANNGQDRLYLNDGTGTFTDATTNRLPVDTDATSTVGHLDADGDGDLDLVFGNGYGQPRLYRNNGAGTFTDVSNNLPAGSLVVRGIAVGDVDGDGDADLVLANLGAERLWRNQGNGVFVDATATALPADNDDSRAAVLKDLDNDGDLDLLVANQGPARLCLGDPGGDFAAIDHPRLASGNTRCLAAGDVDGDGDPDLVLGKNGQSELWRNDGCAAFTDATAASLPPATDSALGVALGDVDGDGDLDIVIANGGYANPQNRLLRNSGTGTFTDVTATHLPPDTDWTTGVALGDVDGDGDLDVVFANQGQSRLLVNDGTGGFTDVTPTQLPTLTDATQGLALVDVDGDGDRDLVLANWGPTRLLRNDGSGAFTDVTATSLPIDFDGTNCVVAGDVDGDGDLDLAFGTGGGWIPYYGWHRGTKLYRNTGNGTFTDDSAASLPMDSVATSALAFGDVDGDGDLDLVVGKPGTCYYWFCSGDQPRVYVNHGGGVFADGTTPAMPAELARTKALLLADLDGDDDNDLVLGNAGIFASVDPDLLWLGLRRQLHAPYPLRLGRTAALEVHARSDPASQTDLALPCLSLGRATVAVPGLGTLGIQPMVTLPLLGVPKSTGIAWSAWTVPNAPSLAGVSVFAQAVLFEVPILARFTNVTGDVVLR